MSYIAIRDNNSTCKPTAILVDTVEIFKVDQPPRRGRGAGFRLAPDRGHGLPYTGIEAIYFSEVLVNRREPDIAADEHSNDTDHRRVPNPLRRSIDFKELPANPADFPLWPDIAADHQAPPCGIANRRLHAIVR